MMSISPALTFRVSVGRLWKVTVALLARMMTYLVKTCKHLEGVQMKYRSLKIWSIVQSIAGSLTLALQRNLKTIKFTQRCMAQGGGTGYMTRLPVDLIEAKGYAKENLVYEVLLFG